MQLKLLGRKYYARQQQQDQQDGPIGEGAVGSDEPDSPIAHIRRLNRNARSNAVERVAHLFTEEEKLQASMSARNHSMRGSRAEEEKRSGIGAEALPTSENQVLHYRATTMLTNEDMARNMNTDVRVTEGPLSRATGARSRDMF